MFGKAMAWLGLIYSLCVSNCRNLKCMHISFMVLETFTAKLSDHAWRCSRAPPVCRCPRLWGYRCLWRCLSRTEAPASSSPPRRHRTPPPGSHYSALAFWELQFTCFSGSTICKLKKTGQEHKLDYLIRLDQNERVKTMSCTLYHLKHCIHLKCGAKSEVWTTTLFP